MIFDSDRPVRDVTGRFVALTDPFAMLRVSIKKSNGNKNSESPRESPPHEKTPRSEERGVFH